MRRYGEVKVAVVAAVVPQAAAVEEVGHPAVVEDPPQEGQTERKAQQHKQSLTRQLEDRHHQRQQAQVAQRLHHSHKTGGDGGKM
jgi:hypothetical protein